MEIGTYDASMREAILDLSIRAWRPVFADLSPAVPEFVYKGFYPSGWESRQTDDLADVLDNHADSVHVAVDNGVVLGWVSVRLHPGDNMGEIYVLAVDPDQHRRGIGTALMERAFGLIRDAGMAMVMVETGDDPGHAPSRATYESAGFLRWPVARYFKDLTVD